MLIEVKLAGKVMYRATEEAADLSRATIASMKAGGYQVYRDGKRVA